MATNNLVQWAYMSAAKYAAIATKDPMTLYFLKDTKEIYRGGVAFTEPTVFVDALPEKGALGKLYFINGTMEGSVWTGSAWKKTISGIKATVDATDTGSAVTGKGVADYVAANTATDFGWDGVTHSLTYKVGETSKSVPLTKLGVALDYDGATGIISLKDKDGTELSTANIPLDNFVKSGKYDEDTKDIVLTLQNGNEVRVPAAALVDVYTGDNTVTAAITVTADNKIKADVRVSDQANNMLQVLTDESGHAGLYVAQAVTDISGKMDKLDAAKAGFVIVAGDDGNAASSDKTIGGATFAETPNADTLATEVAVKTYVDAIKATLDTTLAGKIGTDKIVATLDPTNPSADKVASEAAVVTAISWQIVEDDPVNPVGPTA